MIRLLCNSTINYGSQRSIIAMHVHVLQYHSKSLENLYYDENHVLRINPDNINILIDKRNLFAIITAIQS